MSIVLLVPLTELEGNDPPASPFSVFVDDSGVKHRRARRVGRLLGLGLLVYALVLLAGVVRPLPFPGVGLPQPAEDHPVQLRTVPLPPKAPDGEDILLGRTPGFEAAAVAGTEAGTPGSTIPGPPLVAEPSVFPAPPPVPAAALAPVPPAPSGTVVAGHPDRAPRATAATAPRPAAAKRSPTSAAGGAPAEPAEPAEPPGRAPAEPAEPPALRRAGR